MDPVIDALATYRLTRLAQVDEFPPAAALRHRILNGNAPEVLKYLYECPWCLSMWIGLGVAIARRRAPRLWRSVGFALAASAVTGLITEREP
jgi:hypothetical protein